MFRILPHKSRQRILELVVVVLSWYFDLVIELVQVVSNLSSGVRLLALSNEDVKIYL